jgi:hypothetical protein
MFGLFLLHGARVRASVPAKDASGAPISSVGNSDLKMLCVCLKYLLLLYNLGPARTFPCTDTARFIVKGSAFYFGLTVYNALCSVLYRT